MSRAVKILHSCILMLLLVSCGDIFMKKDSEVEIPQYGTCSFDSEALAKILSENIKGDIECLQSNLLLFMDVVKTDRKGYLSQRELAKYIKANIEVDTEETVRVLKAVFEVNSLLFGDDKGYIEEKNVSQLTKILIDLNQYMVEGKVYEYFSVEESVSFDEHNRRKASVYSALYKVGKAFEEVAKLNDKELNLTKFLEHFENVENNEVIEYVKKLSFIKKAVLGGDADILTSSELKHLSSIFGDVGKIAYDFLNFSDIVDTNKDEDEELLKILKEDVNTARENFYYKDSSSEVIFDYKQLEDIVTTFFPSLATYVKYKESFLKIKNIFLGSDSEEFTSGEINILFNEILYKNLAKGVFFYRVFTQEESTFARLRRIIFDFSGLVTVDPIEESFKADFNRIVQNYRFMQGADISPYFSYHFHRNPRGIFEISVLEDLVKRVFTHYGEFDTTAQGGYTLSQEKLVAVMTDFTEILEGEGYILPGRVANTAETITLMATLFHYQSNGDGRIEIPELVEFAVTVSSSLSLTTKLQSYMESVCDDIGDNSISPECFRDNFISFLEENEDEKVVKDYMPELAKYLEGLAPEEKTNYILSTSRFSRTCSTFTDGEEVPMKYGDYIVSIAGLLLIEQSIIKLDTSGRRGILDLNEVYRTYDLYKSAVEGLIPVEFLKKYSKEIFLYIVKYKEVPELPEYVPEEITGNWAQRSWQRIRGRLRQFVGAAKAGKKLLTFMYDLKFNDGDKNIFADRMTFAAVLEIIAQSSPANKENPYPCDNLRNTP